MEHPKPGIWASWGNECGFLCKLPWIQLFLPVMEMKYSSVSSYFALCIKYHVCVEGATYVCIHLGVCMCVY